jgi:hypothetical protein
MKKIEKFVEFTIVLVATETGFLLNYIQKVLLRNFLIKNKKTYAQIAEKISNFDSYITAVFDVIRHNK